MLNRIYGSARVGEHNHGTTLSSLTFAGTIVGMLLFGYLSDKVGRKFGMASGFLYDLFSPFSVFPQRSEPGIGASVQFSSEVFYFFHDSGVYFCLATRRTCVHAIRIFDALVPVKCAPLGSTPARRATVRCCHHPISIHAHSISRLFRVER